MAELYEFPTKEEAIDWARDSANAYLQPHCVWWSMVSKNYLVYAEGVRPVTYFVSKDITVEPED